MAFSTIKWKRGKGLVWKLSIVIGLVLSLRISFLEETVTLFLEYNDTIVTILLALLAIQVGAYALFQALLSEEIIILMHKKDNLLEKANEEFIGTILLYFYAVVISVFTGLMVLPFPEDFCLFSSLVATNFCALTLLFVFFSFNMRVIMESRNFFVNLYNLMRSNYLIIINKNLENEEKNNLNSSVVSCIRQRRKKEKRKRAKRKK